MKYLYPSKHDYYQLKMRLQIMSAAEYFKQS